MPFLHELSAGDKIKFESNQLVRGWTWVDGEQMIKYTLGRGDRATVLKVNDASIVVEIKFRDRNKIPVKRSLKFKDNEDVKVIFL